MFLISTVEQIFEEKIFAREIFFAGTCFADREKKTRESRKIRTRNNLVPHDSWDRDREFIVFYLLIFLYYFFRK